ncbi:MAG: shikimate kinase [Flavobacteriales bacterium]|jgi:shikimate kinase|uniref:shikimate kinase n=1 Tax=Blattabacterium sp. (Mastotermes darwiniensis) TaxID=39768 RepID=UPI000231DFBF|nr:shikimate kinase [Blattabacterium sp. (Mastotermes darwiniensis)]AER40471.1 shikimate kinase [Blattabacterium sp. (Mastotermes darwiniensis) str. MADAR]MDR1805013.1 shikimate kinase [Flavobacteriales bacterium]
MRVTLIGYMGCGKTSIGKILSYKLKWNFYDLDSILIKKEQDTIDNIFKKKGEKFFRKIEHLMLQKILKKHKQYILSVGGGTPCYYNNIYLLNKFSKTFYLKTNIYTLFKRLYKEKKNRPLISHFSKNELFKFIMKHFSKRIFFYEKSYKKINVTEKSKDEIVQEIIKYLIV